MSRYSELYKTKWAFVSLSKLSNSESKFFIISSLLQFLAIVFLVSLIFLWHNSKHALSQFIFKNLLLISSLMLFKNSRTDSGFSAWFKKDFSSASMLWTLLPLTLKFFSAAILFLTNSICFFRILILYL